MQITLGKLDFGGTVRINLTESKGANIVDSHPSGLGAALNVPAVRGNNSRNHANRVAA